MNKQSEILQLLYDGQPKYKKELNSLVSFGYYHNGDKHFGDVLSRMVKNGSLIRLSKGVYKISGKEVTRKKIKDSINQTKLI